MKQTWFSKDDAPVDYSVPDRLKEENRNINRLNIDNLEKLNSAAPSILTLAEKSRIKLNSQVTQRSKRTELKSRAGSQANTRIETKEDDAEANEGKEEEVGDDQDKENGLQ